MTVFKKMVLCIGFLSASFAGANFTQEMDTIEEKIITLSEEIEEQGKRFLDNPSNLDLQRNFKAVIKRFIATLQKVIDSAETSQEKAQVVPIVMMIINLEEQLRALPH